MKAFVNPTMLTQRIAEQTRLFAPQSSGAAVCMRLPRDEMMVVSAHGVPHQQLGKRFSLTDTFSGRAIRYRRLQVMDDINDEDYGPKIQQMAAQFGVRSCMAVPLICNDRVVGVLTVVASTPGAFGAADVEKLSVVSHVVAALISSHSEIARLLDHLPFNTSPTRFGSSAAEFLARVMMPECARLDREHVALDGLLGPGGTQIVFQPIVDMRSDSVVAVEALSRFPDATQRDTLQWFSWARKLGRGIDLELHALRAAIDASRALPPELALAVNLSPGAAADPVVPQLLASIDREVIVEFTEHEPWSETNAEQTVETLRRSGIKLAVDDAGAGYASLTTVLRVKPDYIKIDKQLIDHCDSDPVCKVLIEALVHVADRIGATTVAEAVENPQQRAAVRDMDVTWGQGYLFGRPGSAEDVIGLLTEL